MDDKRIEIHLSNFGMSFDKSADPKEDVLERFDVRTRGSAIAVQLRECLQRPDHAAGVAVGDRGDAHGHVLEELGVNTAGPASEHRTEMLVLYHPHQHLNAGGRHRLNLEAGS